MLFSWVWRRQTDLLPATCQRVFSLATRLPARKSSLLTLVYPFHWRVWLVVSTSTLLMSVTLTVVNRLLTLSDSPQVLDFDSFSVFSISVGIMISEGILHRLLSLKTSLTMHILLLVWIPMSCLIGMAYQSNLLAALVKADMDEPVGTFEDIIAKDVKIYLTKATVVPHLLSKSPRETVRRAYLKQAVFVTQNEDGSSQDYLFSDTLDDRAVYDSFTERLTGMGHLFQAGRQLGIGLFPCGFYCKINDPLMEAANPVVQILIDVGIYRRLAEAYSWERTAPEREFYRRAAHRPWWPVTFHNVLSTLVPCVGLLLLSCAVACAESFISSPKRKKIEQI